MRSASTARSRIDPEALRALVTVAAFLRAAGYNVPNVGRRMACVLHDGGNPTSFSFTCSRQRRSDDGCAVHRL